MIYKIDNKYAEIYRVSNRYQDITIFNPGSRKSLLLFERLHWRFH